MPDYAVTDKDGVRWDYCTSKSAAETSRKALDKRQPQFKPFSTEPVNKNLEES